jgi:hypothetical protein
LDCGSHVSDGDRRFGPELRMETTRFSGYEREFYRGDDPAPVWHATHVFSKRPIRFRLHGLDARKSYRLGLSWWDFDAQGSVQSVDVETFDGASRFPLRAAQSLPVWTSKQDPPAEFGLLLPRDAYADGRMKIIVSGIPGKETVIGELWLLEASER